MVLHGAKELVGEGAIEDVVEEVVVMIMSDCLAVFEADLFVPRLLHMGLSETRFDPKRKPPRKYIILIRTFYKIMASRWMMASLFQKYLRAIPTYALIRLPQNRIQWLLNYPVIILLRCVLSYNALYSFYRFVCLRSCII